MRKNMVAKLLIALSVCVLIPLAASAGDAKIEAFQGDYTGIIDGKSSVTFKININATGHIAGGLTDRSNADFAYGMPVEGQVKANGEFNIFVGDHADYKENSPYNVIGKIGADGSLNGKNENGNSWKGAKEK